MARRLRFTRPAQPIKEIGMNPRTSSFVLAAALASALSLAACNRSPSTPSGTSSAPPPSTSSAGTDAKRAAEDATASANRAADKAGEAANRAADKTGQAASDSAITAKVKAALIAEPGLDSLDIHVDTKDGAVTLSGNVDAPAKRDRAKQVATAVEGVRNVVDNLTVKRS
jgi:osmotically-inducible protein OsmY